MRKPLCRPVRTTARTAAFMPGASPPLVRTPIVLICFSIEEIPSNLFLSRTHRSERSHSVTDAAQLPATYLLMACLVKLYHKFSAHLKIIARPVLSDIEFVHRNVILLQHSPCTTSRFELLEAAVDGRKRTDRRGAAELLLDILQIEDDRAYRHQRCSSRLMHLVRTRWAAAGNGQADIEPLGGVPHKVVGGWPAGAWGRSPQWARCVSAISLAGSSSRTDEASLDDARRRFP